MSYLKYNVDEINDLVKLYREYADDMNTIEEAMKTMLDGLEGAWDTEAGDEFRKKYNEEWLENFIHYRSVLRHMANSLEIAAQKYQEVTNEAKKLKLN